MRRQYVQFVLVYRVGATCLNGIFRRRYIDDGQNLVKLRRRKRRRSATAEVHIAKRNALVLGKLQRYGKFPFKFRNIRQNVFFHFADFAACKTAVTASAYAKRYTHVHVGGICAVTVQIALLGENIGDKICLLFRHIQQSSESLLPILSFRRQLPRKFGRANARKAAPGHMFAGNFYKQIIHANLCKTFAKTHLLKFVKTCRVHFGLRNSCKKSRYVFEFCVIDVLYKSDVTASVIA